MQDQNIITNSNINTIDANGNNVNNVTDPPKLDLSRIDVRTNLDNKSYFENLYSQVDFSEDPLINNVADFTNKLVRHPGFAEAISKKLNLGLKPDGLLEESTGRLNQNNINIDPSITENNPDFANKIPQLSASLKSKMTDGDLDLELKADRLFNKLAFWNNDETWVDEAVSDANKQGLTWSQNPNDPSEYLVTDGKKFKKVRDIEGFDVMQGIGTAGQIALKVGTSVLSEAGSMLWTAGAIGASIADGERDDINLNIKLYKEYLDNPIRKFKDELVSANEMTSDGPSKLSDEEFSNLSYPAKLLNKAEEFFSPESIMGGSTEDMVSSMLEIVLPSMAATNLLKLGKLGKYTNKLDNVVKNLTKNVKNERIAGLADALYNGVTYGSVATFLESGMEAREQYHTELEKYKKDPLLTDEEAEAAAYNSAIRVRNGNVGLLSVSNMIEGAIINTPLGLIAGSGKKMLEFGMRAGISALSEAGEEGGQFLISKEASKYNAIENKPIGAINYFKDLYGELKANYDKPEFIESIVGGALLGTSMTGFSSGKEAVDDIAYRTKYNDLRNHFHSELASGNNLFTEFTDKKGVKTRLRDESAIIANQKALDEISGYSTAIEELVNSDKGFEGNKEEIQILLDQQIGTFTLSALAKNPNLTPDDLNQVLTRELTFSNRDFKDLKINDTISPEEFSEMRRSAIDMSVKILKGNERGLVNNVELDKEKFNNNHKIPISRIIEASNNKETNESIYNYVHKKINQDIEKLRLGYYSVLKQKQALEYDAPILDKDKKDTGKTKKEVLDENKIKHARFKKLADKFGNAVDNAVDLISDNVKNKSKLDDYINAQIDFRNKYLELENEKANNRFNKIKNYVKNVSLKTANKTKEAISKTTEKTKEKLSQAEMMLGKRRSKASKEAEQKENQEENKQQEEKEEGTNEEKVINEKIENKADEQTPEKTSIEPVKPSNPVAKTTTQNSKESVTEVPNEEEVGNALLSEDDFIPAKSKSIEPEPTKVEPTKVEPTVEEIEEIETKPAKVTNQNDPRLDHEQLEDELKNNDSVPIKVSKFVSSIAQSAFKSIKRVFDNKVTYLDNEVPIKENAKIQSVNFVNSSTEFTVISDLSSSNIDTDNYAMAYNPETNSLDRITLSNDEIMDIINGEGFPYYPMQSDGKQSKTFELFPVTIDDFKPIRIQSNDANKIDTFIHTPIWFLNNPRKYSSDNEMMDLIQKNREFRKSLVSGEILSVKSYTPGFSRVASQDNTLSDLANYHNAIDIPISVNFSNDGIMSSREDGLGGELLIINKKEFKVYENKLYTVLEYNGELTKFPLKTTNLSDTDTGVQIKNTLNLISQQILFNSLKNQNNKKLKNPELLTNSKLIENEKLLIKLIDIAQELNILPNSSDINYIDDTIENRHNLLIELFEVYANSNSDINNNEKIGGISIIRNPQDGSVSINSNQIKIDNKAISLATTRNLIQKFNTQNNTDELSKVMNSINDTLNNIKVYPSLELMKLIDSNNESIIPLITYNANTKQTSIITKNYEDVLRDTHKPITSIIPIIQENKPTIYNVNINPVIELEKKNTKSNNLIIPNSSQKSIDNTTSEIKTDQEQFGIENEDVEESSMTDIEKQAQKSINNVELDKSILNELVDFHDDFEFPDDFVPIDFLIANDSNLSSSAISLPNNIVSDYYIKGLDPNFLTNEVNQVIGDISLSFTKKYTSNEEISDFQLVTKSIVNYIKNSKILAKNLINKQNDPNTQLNSDEIKILNNLKVLFNKKNINDNMKSLHKNIYVRLSNITLSDAEKAFEKKEFENQDQMNDDKGFTLLSHDSMSKRLRLIFSGIKNSKTNKYYQIDQIITNLYKTLGLNKTNNWNKNSQELLNKLQNSESTINQDLYNYINTNIKPNSPELINQMLHIFYVPNANYVNAVMFNNNFNNSLRILNINNNSLISFEKSEALSNNSFPINNQGEHIIDEDFQKFIIRLSDKNKSINNSDIITYLKAIGITKISEEDLKNIKVKKNDRFIPFINVFESFRDITKKGNTSFLNDYFTKNTQTNTYTTKAKVNEDIFYKDNMFNALFNYIAERDNLLTNITALDGGKQLALYTQQSAVYSRLIDFINSDNSTIHQDHKNLFLTQDRSNINYSTISLQALRKTSGKGDNFTSLSYEDQLLTQVSYFFRDSSNFGRNKRASYLTPAYSDKKRVLTVDYKRYKFEPNTTDNSKYNYITPKQELFFKNLIQPELNRISKTTNVSNLKNYFPYLFFSVPSINSIPEIKSILLRLNENLNKYKNNKDFPNYNKKEFNTLKNELISELTSEKNKELMLNSMKEFLHNRVLKTQLEFKKAEIGSPIKPKFDFQGIKSISNYKLNFIDSAVLSEYEIGINDNIESNPEDIAKKLAKLSIVQDKLARDFILNNILVQNNFKSILEGDISQFVKTSANLDLNSVSDIDYDSNIKQIINDTINNNSKRLSKMVSPSTTLQKLEGVTNKKDYNKILTFKSPNSRAFQISKIISLLDNNINYNSVINLLKNNSFTKDESDSLINNANLTTESSKEDLINFVISVYDTTSSNNTVPTLNINSIFPNSKQYFDIDHADALEYVTYNHHLDMLLDLGEITQLEYDEIDAKIKDPNDLGKSLTVKERGHLFNAFKPLTVGHYINNDGEKIDVFIKSSHIPLIPTFTIGTPLDDLRKYMQSRNIQRASTSSSVKQGLSKDAPNIFESSTPGQYDKFIDFKKLDAIIGYNNKSGKHSENHILLSIKREFTGKQLETGYKTKKFNSNSVQQKKAIGRVVQNEKISNNSNIKVKDILKNITDLYKKYHKDSLRKLYDEIGDFQQLDSEGIPKYKLNQLKIRSLLIKEAKSRDKSLTEQDFLNLYINENINENAQIISRAPLWSMTNSNSAESLLLSIMTKGLIRPEKRKGIAAPQISDVGVLKGDNRSGITWIGNQNREKLQFFNEEGVAEIIIPFNFPGKVSDYTYKEGPNKGLINHELLPEKLLKGLSYRIPGQGHSSMMSFKVVGFLPEAHSNHILVPSEITAQMGSDFDIDKLYAYLGTYTTIRKQPKDVINNEEVIKLKELINPLIKKLNQLDNANESILELAKYNIENPNSDFNKFIEITNKLEDLFDINKNEEAELLKEYQQLKSKIEDIYNELPPQKLIPTVQYESIEDLLDQVSNYLSNDNNDISPIDYIFELENLIASSQNPEIKKTFTQPLDSAMADLRNVVEKKAFIYNEHNLQHINNQLRNAVKLGLTDTQIKNLEIQQYENKYGKSFSDPLVQLEKFQSGSSGKTGTGVFSKLLTFSTMLINNNVKYTPAINKLGNVIKSTQHIPFKIKIGDKTYGLDTNLSNQYDNNSTKILAKYYNSINSLGKILVRNNNTNQLELLNSDNYQLDVDIKNSIPNSDNLLTDKVNEILLELYDNIKFRPDRVYNTVKELKKDITRLNKESNFKFKRNDNKNELTIVFKNPNNLINYAVDQIENDIKNNDNIDELKELFNEDTEFNEIKSIINASFNNTLFDKTFNYTLPDNYTLVEDWSSRTLFTQNASKSAINEYNTQENIDFNINQLQNKLHYIIGYQTASVDNANEQILDIGQIYPETFEFIQTAILSGWDFIAIQSIIQQPIIKEFYNKIRSYRGYNKEFSPDITNQAIISVLGLDLTIKKANQKLDLVKKAREKKEKLPTLNADELSFIKFIDYINNYEGIASETSNNEPIIVVSNSSKNIEDNTILNRKSQIKILKTYLAVNNQHKELKTIINNFNIDSSGIGKDFTSLKSIVQDVNTNFQKYNLDTLINNTINSEIFNNINIIKNSLDDNSLNKQYHYQSELNQLNSFLTKVVGLDFENANKFKKNDIIKKAINHFSNIDYIKNIEKIYNEDSNVLLHELLYGKYGKQSLNDTIKDIKNIPDIKDNLFLNLLKPINIKQKVSKKKSSVEFDIVNVNLLKVIKPSGLLDSKSIERSVNDLYNQNTVLYNYKNQYDDILQYTTQNLIEDLYKYSILTGTDNSVSGVGTYIPAIVRLNFLEKTMSSNKLENKINSSKEDYALSFVLNNPDLISTNDKLNIYKANLHGIPHIYIKDNVGKSKLLGVFNYKTLYNSFISRDNYINSIFGGSVIYNKDLENEKGINLEINKGFTVGDFFNKYNIGSINNSNSKFKASSIQSKLINLYTEYGVDKLPIKYENIITNTGKYALGSYTYKDIQNNKSPFITLSPNSALYKQSNRTELDVLLHEGSHHILNVTWDTYNDPNTKSQLEPFVINILDNIVSLHKQYSLKYPNSYIANSSPKELIMEIVANPQLRLQLQNLNNPETIGINSELKSAIKDAKDFFNSIIKFITDLFTSIISSNEIKDDVYLSSVLYLAEYQNYINKINGDKINIAVQNANPQKNNKQINAEEINFIQQQEDLSINNIDNTIPNLPSLEDLNNNQWEQIDLLQSDIVFAATINDKKAINSKSLYVKVNTDSNIDYIVPDDTSSLDDDMNFFEQQSAFNPNIPNNFKTNFDLKAEEIYNKIDHIYKNRIININAKLKLNSTKLIKEELTNKQVAALQNSNNKLEEELEDLENKFIKLSESNKINEVISAIDRDFTYLKNTLSDTMDYMPSESQFNYINELIDTYKVLLIPDKGSDNQTIYQQLFENSTYSDEVINSYKNKLNEYTNQLNDFVLYNNAKTLMFVNDYVKNEFNMDVDVNEIKKDITILGKWLLNVDRTDEPLIDIFANSIIQTISQIDKDVIVKNNKLDKLLDKIKHKLNPKGNFGPFSIFYNKDGDLIEKYVKFYDFDKKLTKSISKESKKLKNIKYELIKDNAEFDYTANSKYKKQLSKLNSAKNDYSIFRSNNVTTINPSKLNDLDYVKSILNNTNNDKIELAKKRYDSYLQHYNVMKKGLQEQVALGNESQNIVDNILKEYRIKNDPTYLIKYKEYILQQKITLSPGTEKIDKSEFMVFKQDSQKEEFIYPKYASNNDYVVESINNIGKIKDNTGKYINIDYRNPEFSKIQSDVDLYNYYTFAYEILKHGKSVMPKHETKDLKSTTLPWIEKLVYEGFWKNFKLAKWETTKMLFAKLLFQTTANVPTTIQERREGSLKTSNMFNPELNIETLVNEQYEERLLKDGFDIYNTKNRPNFEVEKEIKSKLKTKIVNDLGQYRSYDLHRILKVYISATVEYQKKSENLDLVTTLYNKAHDKLNNENKGKLVTKGNTVVKDNNDNNVTDIAINKLKLLESAFKEFTNEREFEPILSVSKKILSPTEKYRAKTYKSLISHYENKIKESEKDSNLIPKYEKKILFYNEKLENLGSKVYLEKVASVFNKLAIFNALAFAPKSFLPNAVYGFMQNDIHSYNESLYSRDTYKKMQNEIYGKSSVTTWGSGVLGFTLGSAIFPGLGLITGPASAYVASKMSKKSPQSSKVINLMYKRDIIQKSQDEMNRSTNLKRKGNRKLNSFAFIEQSEIPHQAVIIGSLLTDNKFIHPETNKETSLMSMLDKEGNLTNSGLVITDPYNNSNKITLDNFLSTVLITANTRIALTHGDYRKGITQMIKKHGQLSYLSTMKTWMFESFASRYEPEKANYNLRDLKGNIIHTKGYYRTAYEKLGMGSIMGALTSKFLLSNATINILTGSGWVSSVVTMGQIAAFYAGNKYLSKEITTTKNPELNKIFYQSLVNSFGKFTKLDKFIDLYKDSPEKLKKHLNPIDAENMQKLIRELTWSMFYTLTYAVVLLLKGSDDDDEKDKNAKDRLLNYTLNFTGRMISDLDSYHDVSDAYKKNKSTDKILPFLKTVENLSFGVKTLINLDRYEKNYKEHKKGDLKAPTYFKKEIPIFNQISKTKKLYDEEFQIFSQD